MPCTAQAGQSRRVRSYHALPALHCSAHATLIATQVVNNPASAGRAATRLGLRGSDGAVRSAVQGVTAQLARLFPQAQWPGQRTAARSIGAAAAATEAAATGSAPAAQQVVGGGAGGNGQQPTGGSRQQAEQDAEVHAEQQLAQPLADANSDSESDAPLAKRPRLSCVE